MHENAMDELGGRRGGEIKVRPQLRRCSGEQDRASLIRQNYLSLENPNLKTVKK